MRVYTALRLSVIPSFRNSDFVSAQYLAKFAYVLMLTRSRLGLLHVNFLEYTTQLWAMVYMSKNHFRSISCERIDGIGSNFTYT